MVPFLFLIVYAKGKWAPLWHEIRKKPFFWLKWSFTGFVLFLCPDYVCGGIWAGLADRRHVADYNCRGCASVAVFLRNKTFTGGPGFRQTKDPADFAGYFRHHPDRSRSDSASACGFSVRPHDTIQRGAGRHRGFCLSARQPQNAGTIRRKTRYVSAGARHDARKPSVLAFDRRFRLA